MYKGKNEGKKWNGGRGNFLKSQLLGIAIEEKRHYLCTIESKLLHNVLFRKRQFARVWTAVSFFVLSAVSGRILSS